jgi:hypothetical protein
MSSDHQTFTNLTGTATCTNNLFNVSSGTDAGAYAVIRSRRAVDYKAGNASKFRLTAMFSSPVANSLQLCGSFNATSYLGFGYSGTQFGLLHRISGSLGIYKLTLTIGTGGNTTHTLTLNSIPFILATTGVQSTTVLAETLSEGYASALDTGGWYTESIGSVIYFMQKTPSTLSGTFTYTSNGTATGTITNVQVGSPNNDITDFIPQSDWNVDKMDGSYDSLNPSGSTLNPFKLNVFQILYPYLGAGDITYMVMVDGGFKTVHVLKYSNYNIVTNTNSPCMRLGWTVASLGSTTNLTLKGASAGGFTEGIITEPSRYPFGYSVTNFSASTTEYTALALRNSLVFKDVENHIEAFPQLLSFGVETTQRVVTLKIYLNPTLTGALNWLYVDTNSCMQYSKPTNITPSGGVLIGSYTTGTDLVIDFSNIKIRILPTDVFVITLQTASSTAVVDFSVQWRE